MYFPFKHFLVPAALALAPHAHADLTFGNFNTSNGLSLVGSASTNFGRLRLNASGAGTTGAAWATVLQDVSQPWTTSFRVQLDSGLGSGFAFVLQGQGRNALGLGDCGMGFDGLNGSIAIEFDTQTDLFCGSSLTSDGQIPHVALNSGGVGGNLGNSSWLSDFSDGQEHLIRITYAPGALSVYVDDMNSPSLTVTVDLSTLNNSPLPMASVGFSAASGNMSGIHEILDWTFDEQSQAPSGNHPPATPVITEPSQNNQSVNPFDVHMETSPFSDPDAGDSHSCSDYEIWRLSPTERVWRADCRPWPTAAHMHLADGVFEGSHLGRQELDENTVFFLRARHSDSSGDAASQWSPWGSRSFQTGAWSTRFPLEIEDVIDQVPPTWIDGATGNSALFPPGSSGHEVLLESPHDELMLSLTPGSGGAPTYGHGVLLSHHEPVRITISAGPQALTLPATDLSFHNQDCRGIKLLLPPVQLSPNSDLVLWASWGGTTWHATTGNTTPSFDVLARGSDVPWTLMQDGYSIEVFAEDLDLPVNIAFVPNPGPLPGDPFLYVTELYGRIRMVTRDGTLHTYADNLLNYTPTGSFPGDGEQGVTGIAVDPLTGDVYATMLYSSGPAHFPKVVAFTSIDGGRTAATSQTILDMVGEPQGQSHQISHLEFMPDGSLLVHNGDGFNAGAALNLNSFRGKILRILTNGTPHPGNPFFDAGNGLTATDYIWAYGLRNPFGGDYRHLDSTHYMVGNGPSVDRLAAVHNGDNMGWNGTDASMGTNALHNWAPAVGPVNLVFLQPEVFSGSGFPSHKMGHGFITESGPTYAAGTQILGKRITEWVIDASGNLVSGPMPFIEYTGTGRATAVGLEAGPDGLYFTEFYLDTGGSGPASMGARILRVAPTVQIDCNGNGISDPCEVASGTVPDANGDGIPDECVCSPQTICLPQPNSAGPGAMLSATPGCDVGANSLTFEVAGLPQNQFGYFLCSQNAASVAVAQGVLCLGPPIARFNQFALNSGTTGTVQFQPDLNSPPPLAAFNPGDTWIFQLWYRDQNPGPTSNFSGAIEILFH